MRFRSKGGYFLLVERSELVRQASSAACAIFYRPHLETQSNPATPTPLPENSFLPATRNADEGGGAMASAIPMGDRVHFPR